MFIAVLAIFFMISYSAPAKVIISGEHAVVYGKPALVSAIDKRLTFTIDYWSSKDDRLRKSEKINKNIKMIDKVVKKYLEKEKIRFKEKEYLFKIQSEIPLGRGLGSSAALSVAAVSSFLAFYTEKQWPKEVINNLSYTAEKYFHNNPSGVDNTASCFGSLIYFRREFEFLKNISLLNFKIPKKFENNLFLIDSGKPEESTKTMVEWVKERYNKEPTLIEEIFNQIEKTTKKIVISLIKEDEDFFINSFIDNQSYLEVLGVVSKKTKRLLRELEKFGWGKITGAGGIKKGSGFILFYSQRKKQLESFLREKGINFFKFSQDFSGVKKI